MQFTVRERLLALDILPEYGNLDTMFAVREVRRALDFSASEIKALQFLTTNGVVTWNRDAETEIEAELTARAWGMLATRLRELDNARILTEDHLSLCDKVMPQE